MHGHSARVLDAGRMQGLVRPGAQAGGVMRGEMLFHRHGAPGTVGNLSRGASRNLGHSFGGVSVDPDEAN